jgi:hypothetical protein
MMASSGCSGGCKVRTIVQSCHTPVREITSTLYVCAVDSAHTGLVAVAAAVASLLLGVETAPPGLPMYRASVARNDTSASCALECSHAFSSVRSASAKDQLERVSNYKQHVVSKTPIVTQHCINWTYLQVASDDVYSRSLLLCGATEQPWLPVDGADPPQ